MSRPLSGAVVPAIVNYIHASALSQSILGSIRLHPSDLFRFFNVPESTARRYFLKIGFNSQMYLVEAQRTLANYLRIPVSDLSKYLDQILVQNKAIEISSWRRKVVQVHTEELNRTYKQERVQREIFKQMPLPGKRAIR